MYVHSSDRTFTVGEEVFTHCKPIGTRPVKWLHGIISRRTGPVPFEIELDGRGIVKRHVEMIRKRWCYIPKIPDIIPSTKLESRPTLYTQMLNPSVQLSESEPQSSILESENLLPIVQNTCLHPKLLRHHSGNLLVYKRDLIVTLKIVITAINFQDITLQLLCCGVVFSELCSEAEIWSFRLCLNIRGRECSSFRETVMITLRFP